MFCRNCGIEIKGAPAVCVGCGGKPMAGKSFCHGCGAETNPMAEICIKCGTPLGKIAERGISPKSRLATTLLAFFLGELGAHRFYIGKMLTGIEMLVLFILGMIGMVTQIAWLMLICLIAVNIWAFVDFIFAVIGKMTDREGRLIKTW